MARKEKLNAIKRKGPVEMVPELDELMADEEELGMEEKELGVEEEPEMASLSIEKIMVALPELSSQELADLRDEVDALIAGEEEEPEMEMEEEEYA
jgi:hypothetical protein